MLRKQILIATMVLPLIAFSSCEKISSSTSGLKGVDLGLSTEWASCNLGATSPEKPGDFYDWFDAKEAVPSGWRIPTHMEWQELIDNCEWAEEKFNGIDGMIFKSSNGKSIFLPYVGVASKYWASTSGTGAYANHADFFSPNGGYWNKYMCLKTDVICVRLVRK